MIDLWGMSWGRYIACMRNISSACRILTGKTGRMMSIGRCRHIWGIILKLVFEE
jgi:hypothetical protein